MIDRRRQESWWDKWGAMVIQLVLWGLGLVGTAAYGIHQFDLRRAQDMHLIDLRLQRIEIAVGIIPLRGAAPEVKPQ